MRKLTSHDPVVQESATVVVLNGTDTNGIAASNAKGLKARGMSVTIGDAAAPATTSQIIDLSAGKKPATKSLLGKLYGQHISTTNSYAGQYDADFIVIVGSDHLPDTTSGSAQ